MERKKLKEEGALQDEPAISEELPEEHDSES